MKYFFDTNVLVYLFDGDSPAKRKASRILFERHSESGEILLSTQVLQEFYAALTSGASPVPRRAARDLIGAYSVWPIATIDAADLLAASDFEERYRLTFRDALVVVAARKSHATLLLSEHLRPFRPIAGLDVRNPFA